MPDYLKLPLRFEHFFERNKLDTCGIKESIARNLHLLVTTPTGENKQDLYYGSQFWEHDYDIHMANDARREAVITSIKKQVYNYEKRLANVSVEVNVKQSEYNSGINKQLRRRVEIIIEGSIARSNEPFKFQTGFFIGPLSFD